MSLADNDSVVNQLSACIGALAACRDSLEYKRATPESDWPGAMSDPLCVPHYVRENVRELVLTADVYEYELRVAALVIQQLERRVAELEYQYEC